jgi:hypothetical protein
VVLDYVQLSVSLAANHISSSSLTRTFHHCRFPLDVVFRIYDSCLANGIEAIFSFSIQLLRKNEEKLLKMKFDEMLAFLNTKLLDAYKVRPPFFLSSFSPSFLSCSLPYPQKYELTIA